LHRRRRAGGREAVRQGGAGVPRQSAPRTGRVRATRCGGGPCVPTRAAYFSGAMNNNAKVPVGVLGASGYVGRELLRLLARHPGASVAVAPAAAAAGEGVEGDSLL